MFSERLIARIKAICGNDSGETLVETLVSTLINAMSLMLLAATIATSVNMVKNSREKLEDYYSHESTLTSASSGTVSLDIAINAGRGKSESVTLYSDSKYGIVYYERA